MTEQDGANIVLALCAKHNADPIRLFLLMAVIAKAGFGRNEETMAALRTIADIIDVIYDGGKKEGPAVTEPSNDTLQGGYLPPTKGRFQ